MIKTTNNDTALTVDFKNSCNEVVSGKLLTYEITGEACIQVNSERVWIPFSNLSKLSQNKILGTESKRIEKNLEFFKDPKLGLIITLMVLVGFWHYYLKFSL